MIVLSAERVDSQHFKMGWHISVSQKLWSLAQFLYQQSALVSKTYMLRYVAKNALECSFFEVEKCHAPF